VKYGRRIIAPERAFETACDDPNDFGRATEVRASEDCGDPGVGTAPVIAHAGETIDEDFGIVDARLNWPSACKRGGCDNPVTGLY